MAFESLNHCRSQGGLLFCAVAGRCSVNAIGPSPFACADVGDAELVEKCIERIVPGSGEFLLWYDCCRSSQIMPRVGAST